MSIQRFLDAQDEISLSGTSYYNDAWSELREGEKKTHWMWFMFPQLKGLGQSEKSLHYGIFDGFEAMMYMKNPVLRSRYANLVGIVLQHVASGRTLEDIFGSVDAQKFRSSLSLFSKYL
jgi:uncharacterized protein (DUF1810 family)